MHIDIFNVTAKIDVDICSSVLMGIENPCDLSIRSPLIHDPLNTDALIVMNYLYSLVFKLVYTDSMLKSLVIINPRTKMFDQFL